MFLKAITSCFIQFYMFKTITGSMWHKGRKVHASELCQSLIKTYGDNNDSLREHSEVKVILNRGLYKEKPKTV